MTSLSKVSAIGSCYLGPTLSEEQFIPEHFFLYLAKGTISGYDGNEKYTMTEGESCIVRKNHLARYSKQQNMGTFEKIVVVFEEAFLRDVYKRQASVLNQNEGRGVEFILQQEGNTYSFENRTHDFPKQIIYRKISDSEVKVEITNGKRGFGYLMRKTGAGKRRPDTISANPRYDKELAEKLGGDDYGMKGYYLIMLRTGTNDTADKEFISQCFRGHFENMEAMERNGKLVVAGPMGKNEQQYRGIFIINAVSETEARTLIQNDAAIKNNLLQAEIYPWYGSAALPAYLDAADKIWKRKP